MQRNKSLLLSFILGATLAVSAQAEIRASGSLSYSGGSAAVDVGYFHDQLSPYGRWSSVPSYGWVWSPRGINASWRPYTQGRWVDSDYGWTWDSDEPFGWATYHYGRWEFDPQIGWFWVPGTDWGPAWVAWQEGDGYLGWAPLPPQVGYQTGVGLRLGGLDLSLILQPTAYVFVQEQLFLEPRIGTRIVAQSRNPGLFRNSRNITNYGYVNNRIVNRGLDVDRIEQATHRRVQRVAVTQVNSRGSAGLSNNQLRVFRPAEAQLRTVKVGQRNNAGLAARNDRQKGETRAVTSPTPRNGRERQPLLQTPPPNRTATPPDKPRPQDNRLRTRPAPQATPLPKVQAKPRPNAENQRQRPLIETPKTPRITPQPKVMPTPRPRPNVQPQQPRVRPEPRVQQPKVQAQPRVQAQPKPQRPNVPPPAKVAPAQRPNGNGGNKGANQGAAKARPNRPHPGNDGNPGPGN